MINFRMARKYCSEDISLIENYREAVNSKEKWDCHHKDEIDLNKGKSELIKLNLYYKVPADRLVFINQSEHCKLHRSGKNNYQWHDICPLQLFYYRNVEKMSYEKIAEILNCSIATIHRRLNKLNITKDKNITV